MGQDPGAAGAPPAGPGSAPARALAPDLARGFTLLFTALVNTRFFLVGPDPVRTFGDRAAAVAVATWPAAVALAEVLRGAGRRGPVEAVLRRVTYAGSSRSP
ncbi:hypothetical protein [Nocardiopsis sp. CA-288880]|uniref:hypothetical protein n=1 Tax=Nocardiopsis sp. CA-288880 TaxID=3239995 RepID=UPI003D979B78